MITETAAAPSALAPSSLPAASNTTSALTSDFETFLKMLTAQARFQDPLNPIDSTEYAAQLAQFSMVEQQVQTNDVLKALFNQLGAQNPASLAAWVGMEARAVTPMQFDGTPVKILTKPAIDAGAAFLVVRNAKGEEVQRIQVPSGTEEMEWTGLDDAGAPFPGGQYSFEVESQKGGEVVKTEPAPIYARVTEAQLQAGQVVLVMQGGQVVPASAITALREPA